MDNLTRDKLGIIGGGGQLPGLLVETCQTQGRSYCLVAVKGEADEELLALKPDLVIRVGQAGQCFRAFKESGVASIVMAGKVHRPTLIGLRPDFRTLKFLLKSGTRAFTDRHSVGDDKLLRAVIREIESEGFNVLSVADVLADLLVEAVILGEHSPSDQDRDSITVGVQAAQRLGNSDVGQAVVVQSGCIIDEECEEGTNALIQRSRTRHSNDLILVKTSKPNQDRRADLPVIGPETIRECSKAGFRGVAIEAGGTLVLNHEATIKAANDAGLFLIAVDCASSVAKSGA